MSLFNQRKSKSFNYVPRKEKPSINDDRRLEKQWESIKRQGKHKGRRVISLPLLLIFLGMIVAVWYLLTQYQTT